MRSPFLGVLMLGSLVGQLGRTAVVVERVLEPEDEEAARAARLARLEAATQGPVAPTQPSAPTHYLRGGIGAKRAERKARADAARAERREAKRRRQLGLPECSECEDGGWPAFSRMPLVRRPKRTPVAMISSRPPKRDLQEAIAIIDGEASTLLKLAERDVAAHNDEKIRTRGLQRTAKAQRLAGVISWIEAQYG